MPDTPDTYRGTRISQLSRIGSIAAPYGMPLSSGVWNQLLAGAETGGAGSPVHRAVLRIRKRLGHSQQDRGQPLQVVRRVRQTDCRIAHRSEGPRDAEGHAGRLGAASSGARLSTMPATAATTIPGASLSGWPAVARRAAIIMAPPTSRAASRRASGARQRHPCHDSPRAACHGVGRRKGYSDRRALIGSMREARHAGMNPAANEAESRAATLTAKTVGSLALTPKS